MASRKILKLNYGRFLFKSTLSVVVLLSLISFSSAFMGEAAVVKVLLDFLLRMNLNAIGENLVVYAMDICRNYFVDILLLNPDTMDPSILGLTRYIIGILEPVFILAVLISGLYMIFFSGSPGVRARIKSILPGVIIAMVLITLSPYILDTVFYFLGILSRGIMSHGPRDPMSFLLPVDEATNPINYFMSRFQNLTWYSSEASILFLFLALILLAALLIVVFARYIVVALFVVLFPLTIFFYLFIPTRVIGRRMMEQTLLWISIQLTESIALIVIVAIITVFTPLLMNEALVFLRLGGILTLIFIPLATVSFLRDFLPT